MIGSTFPEKLIFENNAFLTAKPNTAIEIIYQINSELEGYKKRKRDTKLPKSGLVHPEESSSNQLSEDLSLIAAFEQWQCNLVG